MPSKPIDLRSDTVTLPTPAMRTAMARAEVGDDVYGEDPTINRLEEFAAQRVGKAAAMFVPSGTMGNLCALLAHCQRGDEVIVGDASHIYNYEAGGASVVGGVAFHVLPNQPDGTIALDHLRAAVRWLDDPHCAETRLICLENTHNSCGGVALSPEYLASVAAFARERGLLVHLDGARMFNAAIALSVDVTELTRHVDSVMFCLSKGLAAPVGSVVCGDEAFIRRARRARKVLGGSMRQAGVIAAAGIVALETMVDRLEEDHANARMLAEGLAGFPQIVIEPERVQTNIVIFTLRDGISAEEFVVRLRERGVLMGDMGGGRVRAVTHYGIDAGDITETLAVAEEVLRTGSGVRDQGFPLH